MKDVLSFIERLSSFGGSKCIRSIGKPIVWYLKIVLSYCAPITESPLLEVSPLVSPHIIFELQFQGAFE